MRQFDIILYGATGFTGRLVAAYLARQTSGLRWAIAGRSTGKLSEVRATLQAGQGSLPDILLADSAVPDTLSALARQTRVMITTVGPYLRHGEPLVAACVSEGCHYVDLTGESEFVNRMRSQHDEAARKTGVKIVHCCGFDSIPHDLGVYYTMRLLQDRLGSEALSTARVEVAGIVRAKGDFSGGTWHSALNAMSRLGDNARAAGLARKHRALLNGRHVHGGLHGAGHVNGEWRAPLPTIDPQVVLTSARALPFYGRDFAYSHLVGVQSLPRLVAGAVGMGALVAGAQVGPLRRWLERRRPAGAGPDASARAGHWFRVRFEASVKQVGGQQTQLVTEVAGGDPGYEETACMLAESALSLVSGNGMLPATAGVLSPAVAMGDVLLNRLQAAGLRFAVLAD